MESSLRSQRADQRRLAHGASVSSGGPNTDDMHPLEPGASHQSNASAENCRENIRSTIPFLPTEILSYIFLLSTLPLDMSIWASPVLAVSSWWRACAIHTAQLWCYIDISGGSKEIERLTCWIHRSGDTRPIHLTVQNVEAFQALEMSWPKDLPQFSSRIYRLVIRPKTITGKHPFPILMDTTHLHEFDADFWCPDTANPPLTLFAAPSSGHLRTLRLHNYCFTKGAIDVTGLNLSVLVSLNLAEEILPPDVLDLLQRATSLRCFNWNLSQLSPEDIFQPQTNFARPSLRLQAMEHLVLRGHSSILLSLLQFVQLPALQRLSLTGFWNSEELDRLILLTSQRRNLTHLEIYSQDGQGPSADNVASLLRALPNLEHIDPIWTDNNIDGLLARYGGSGSASTGSAQECTPYFATSKRLYLPIRRSFEQDNLTGNRLSACLTNIFDFIDTQHHSRTTSFGASGLRGHEKLSPERLVVVVDLDADTMVSIMGERWLTCGGVCAESLDFPQA
ncbi:hypothetical protein DL93DRAFT_280001 [Clavulina sp. PMI_390]|nr:hypothetical protein DL93DRAFT_280001 [Clavulina sp. PMI_390]